MELMFTLSLPLGSGGAGLNCDWPLKWNPGSWLAPEVPKISSIRIKDAEASDDPSG